MSVPAAILTVLALFLGLASGLIFAADDEEGKIMRPVDGAILTTTEADIVATAPSGKLQLDGQPVIAEQPFPDVFHVVLTVTPGVHKLTLQWDGGNKAIRFFSGPNPPAGFALFHQHPPLPGIQCKTCHELSQHGRFRFKGGCFGCHQQDAFAKIHTHNDTVLAQCGMCHNAHGSTVKADLLYPKQTACRQCHE
jgi:predicted CXXCH cytochrome family protein